MFWMQFRGTFSERLSSFKGVSKQCFGKLPNPSPPVKREEGVSYLDNVPNMCWLPIGINNNKLFGLCDSGSSTNLLSSKLALQLGLAVVPDGKFLRLADGKLMPTTGVACVNLLINGSHFSCWFCVCDLIHFPLILGLPFLSQAGVKLDFVHNCFSISRNKGKRVPFPSESEVR